MKVGISILLLLSLIVVILSGTFIIKQKAEYTPREQTPGYINTEASEKVTSFLADKYSNCSMRFKIQGGHYFEWHQSSDGTPILFIWLSKNQDKVSLNTAMIADFLQKTQQRNDNNQNHYEFQQRQLFCTHNKVNISVGSFDKSMIYAYITLHLPNSYHRPESPPPKIV